MNGIKPKTITLGNVEGNGKWKIKPGSKKGEPEKIFKRNGSETIFHKLADKLRGIKDAPEDITRSLKDTFASNTINLSNLSINSGIKFYSTYNPVNKAVAPIIFTSKVTPNLTGNITKNLINDLKEAINFDDIKFDKSHPDYKNLTEKKRLVGDMIEKIAITSTVFRPTDELQEDLTLQKAETKTAFAQLKTMIVDYHQVGDLQDKIKSLSADKDKNKDELKSTSAILEEVSIWSKRIENFSTKLDEIKFIQEKEILGNVWNNIITNGEA